MTQREFELTSIVGSPFSDPPFGPPMADYTALTASRWGQDKRGRRRIPHSQLSLENVSKIWQTLWQNMTACGNTCALKAYIYIYI